MIIMNKIMRYVEIVLEIIFDVNVDNYIYKVQGKNVL